MKPNDTQKYVKFFSDECEMKNDGSITKIGAFVFSWLGGICWRTDQTFCIYLADMILQKLSGVSEA